MTSTTISCADCAMQHSPACDDCVVTFVCRTPGRPVVLDPPRTEALSLLAAVGLAPALLHRPLP